MYCVGFFFVVCAPVSDMTRLLWRECTGENYSAPCSGREQTATLRWRFWWLQQFRTVFLKHSPQHCGSALWRRVYFLNQLINPRSHHQEITEKPGPGVPISVRSAAGHEYRRARLRFHMSVANSHAKRAFKHVPRLVIVVVEMKRSNKSSRPRQAAGIAPFRNHKTVFAGPK